MSDQNELHPAGELHPTGDALSNAIWEAAWFAVNKIDCSKTEFVGIVTRAANEAFDSQMHNAALRLRKSKS